MHLAYLFLLAQENSGYIIGKAVGQFVGVVIGVVVAFLIAKRLQQKKKK
jgi:tetrahydromethanopterin S-methyltransferase subunit G